MVGKTNAGGGAAGATLVITGVVGHSVTASNGSKTYTRTIDSTGKTVIKGLSTGTWTLTMTGDGQTATRTVDVIADYAVTITYFSATIGVTYPDGSTCTCSDGTTTQTAPDTTGSYTFTVPNAGEWTVTATDGNKTKDATVDITTDGQSKSVTLSYETYYYNKGDLCTVVTGGWAKTGTGGSLTFNTASMTLKANSFQNATDASTKNKVSLDNIKTLYFSVKSATSYPTGYPRVGIATTNNPDSSEASKWTASKTLSSSSSFKTVSIDVSSLTGSYYIAVGGYNGDSGSATIEVEAIWGNDQ